jgi:hypothetical protein
MGSTVPPSWLGSPLGAPWDALGWDGSDDEWEFTTAAGDTPEQLYALWDGAVERSRSRLSAALADGGAVSSSTPPAPAALMPASAGSCAT